MEHVELILLEVSLIPVNAGCPLFDQVVQFMSAREFTLLDICSMVRRTDGSLWQTDLLFVQKQSPLVPSSRLDATTWV